MFIDNNPESTYSSSTAGKVYGFGLLQFLSVIESIVCAGDGAKMDIHCAPGLCTLWIRRVLENMLTMLLCCCTLDIRTASGALECFSCSFLLLFVKKRMCG